MFQNLTFNSVFWMIFGIAMFGWGAYNGWVMRRMITSMFVLQTVAGYVLTGLAAILCGFTNGFTDHTPRGRFLRKVGIFLAVTGFPILAYSIYRSI